LCRAEKIKKFYFDVRRCAIGNLRRAAAASACIMFVAGVISAQRGAISHNFYYWGGLVNERNQWMIAHSCLPNFY
jgi:hypothetical protein